MPILQNKLVIKSIEALHDEALAMEPDNVSYADVTAPPVILKTHAPPPDPPSNEPKDTSADASPETAVDQNIMARIDHLLRKLDEDEGVAIAPPLEKGPKSNAAVQTSNAFDSKAGGNSDDIFDDSQKGEKPRPDQSQALADIAEAIYQAQHQAVDNVAADTSQNSSTPFDIDVFSATVADEVRRTVSAVMIAELPHLVRDAVGEEIRALPANALNQSKSVIDNPSAAKTVTARKTVTTRKSGGKKAKTKEPVPKKASVKTSPKKLTVKKPKSKKVGTKTSAKAKP